MTSREARRSIREDVHKYYVQKAAREHESQRIAHARLIGFLNDAGSVDKTYTARSFLRQFFNCVCVKQTAMLCCRPSFAEQEILQVITAPLTIDGKSSWRP